MAQEFVLPLALAYTIDSPENKFFGKENLKEWVKAGIEFSMQSSHTDGSCDDYFPYEKAGGAAAFSLMACMDSYKLLDFNSPKMLEFFEKRTDWLANHEESGQLANHQALIVLCIDLLSNLLNTEKWASLREKKMQKLLSWQSSEGWFQEYEGCDPGYHTLTISVLARIYDMNPSKRLKKALENAIEFSSHFVHPDGSYGGEYGSRNTYCFFPHGFELTGKWMPEALSVNDRFLNGLKKNLSACFEDDHVIAHHTWNYFMAWKDFVEERPETVYPEPGRVWFKEAKLLIDRRKKMQIYIALNKGGVFKLFREDELIVSDTHFSILTKSGKNAVVQLINDFDIEISENKIRISGSFGWVNNTLPTPWKFLFFRVFLLTAGRFFSNFVRKVLQNLLIIGRKQAPFSFVRTFQFQNGGWVVRDQLNANSWDDVKAVGIGSSQASIYVVMSKTFQDGQMKPWIDFTPLINKPDRNQPLQVERSL